MMMFLVRYPIVLMFLFLFVLLECPVMLMTLILVMKQNFSNKDIDIINFVRLLKILMAAF